jgi:ATP-dependent Clp protease ATP-binding subunit ClpA
VTRSPPSPPLVLTDRARRAIGYANDLARRQRCAVGSEHILAGLLADARSVAGLALRALLGTRTEAVQAHVQGLGHGGQWSAGHQPERLPVSTDAARVIAAAAREAAAMGQRAMGTEHLLLGILAVPANTAALSLGRLDHEASRAEIVRVLERKRAIRAARGGQV